MAIGHTFLCSGWDNALAWSALLLVWAVVFLSSGLHLRSVALSSLFFPTAFWGFAHVRGIGSSASLQEGSKSTCSDALLLILFPCCVSSSPFCPTLLSGLQFLASNFLAFHETSASGIEIIFQISKSGIDIQGENGEQKRTRDKGRRGTRCVEINKGRGFAEPDSSFRFVFSLSSAHGVFAMFKALRHCSVELDSL